MKGMKLANDVAKAMTSKKKISAPEAAPADHDADDMPLHEHSAKEGVKELAPRLCQDCHAQAMLLLKGKK